MEFILMNGTVFNVARMQVVTYMEAIAFNYGIDASSDTVIIDRSRYFRTYCGCCDRYLVTKWQVQLVQVLASKKHTEYAGICEDCGKFIDDLIRAVDAPHVHGYLADKRVRQLVDLDKMQSRTIKMKSHNHSWR